MDGHEVRQQMVELVGTRRKVRLTRRFLSEPRHNGFVLALGREWVLFQQFHNFYPEGYTALRVRDITGVRSGEYERQWERMLAGEGLLDQVAAPGALPLDEISHLLTALQRRGENVIVQCEKEMEFYIGRILSVDAGAVRFAKFDALGRWDVAPFAIPFEAITKLQFETPYVRTFSRYLEGPYRRAKRSGGPRRAAAESPDEEVDGRDVRQHLVELVGTRKKVRLTRGFPSFEPWHHGFVLALGREWVLLQQFHDFYAEGYAALRVRDITHVRSGENERHWERMLAAEGLLDQLAVPGALPLDEISQLLTALQQRDQNVVVECEEAVKHYYIGQILSVDARSVCFANFDALGRWDVAPYAIPLREITQVQFETPYVRTFSRYLEGPFRRAKRSGGHRERRGRARAVIEPSNSDVGETKDLTKLELPWFVSLLRRGSSRAKLSRLCAEYALTSTSPPGSPPLWYENAELGVSVCLLRGRVDAIQFFSQPHRAFGGPLTPSFLGVDYSMPRDDIRRRFGEPDEAFGACTTGAIQHAGIDRYFLRGMSIAFAYGISSGQIESISFERRERCK